MPRLIERVVPRELGVVLSDPIELDDTENAVNLIVDRRGWRRSHRAEGNPIVLQMCVEVSYDGGETWRHGTGAGFRGGEHFRRDGSRSTQGRVLTKLRARADGAPARLVRVRAERSQLLLPGDISLDILDAPPRRRMPDPSNSPTLEDSGSGDASASDNVTCGVNPNGTNRALFVQSLGSDVPAGDAAPTVDFGGTSVGDNVAAQLFANYYRHSVDVLVAPDEGEDTVTVTWSETQSDCSVIAAALSDVDQSTPYDTPVTSAEDLGYSSASAGVTSEVGDLVLSSIAIGSGNSTAPTDTGGGTVIAEQGPHTNAYDAYLEGGYEAGAAGTVTRSYSWTGSAGYGLIAFNVNDATSALITQTMGGSAEHLAAVEVGSVESSEHLAAVERAVAADAEVLASAVAPLVGSAEHRGAGVSQSLVGPSEHLVTVAPAVGHPSEHLGIVSTPIGASAEHVATVAAARAVLAEHLITQSLSWNLRAEHVTSVVGAFQADAEHLAAVIASALLEAEHEPAAGVVSAGLQASAEHLAGVVASRLGPSEHLLELTRSRGLPAEHTEIVAVSRILVGEHLLALEIARAMTAEHLLPAGAELDLQPPFTLVWVNPARTLDWS